MAAIVLKDFSVSYSGGGPVLSRLNWQVKAGEWWGVAGSNGSGKTTLLYSLAGLIPGEVKAQTRGTLQVGSAAGLVFQNPDFSLFNQTVAEEAAFGHHRPTGPALKAVGLWAKRNADPQTLSYGAKQKLCLAAVLARDPEIILLDEPASMMDYRSSLNLYQILARLHQQGKTIITVEHDTALLHQFTQKLLLLNRGRLIAQGPSRQLLRRRALLNRLCLKPL